MVEGLGKEKLPVKFKDDKTFPEGLFKGIQAYTFKGYDKLIEDIYNLDSVKKFFANQLKKTE